MLVDVYVKIPYVHARYPNSKKIGKPEEIFPLFSFESRWLRARFLGRREPGADAKRPREQQRGGQWSDLNSADILSASVSFKTRLLTLTRCRYTEQGPVCYTATPLCLFWRYVGPGVPSRPPGLRPSSKPRPLCRPKSPITYNADSDTAPCHSAQEPASTKLSMRPV